MYRVEGLTRMWNGALWSIVGSMPAHAAYFSIYEASKRILGVKSNEFAPVKAGFFGIFSCVFYDYLILPVESNFLYLVLKKRQ